MPTTEGTCGRGARWYGEEAETLRGLLATDTANAVYPDDYCPDCARENNVLGADRCFRHHWEVADEPEAYEVRYDSTRKHMREAR